MGSTFSSGVEAQVPPAATAPAPGGGDDKKLWNDDVLDNYMFMVDAAEVEARQAAVPGGDEKTLWPKLVGRRVIGVAREIMQDRPEVRVYFYDYGKNAPPPGFDPKRVVLFRDSKNLVVTVPKLG